MKILWHPSSSDDKSSQLSKLVWRIRCEKHYSDDTVTVNVKLVLQVKPKNSFPRLRKRKAATFARLTLYHECRED